MARYSFALIDRDAVRETGIVTSDSFSDALDTVGEQVGVRLGDCLEIAVPGFPPARFICTMLIPGELPIWRQDGRLAA